MCMQFLTVIRSHVYGTCIHCLLELCNAWVPLTAKLLSSQEFNPQSLSNVLWAFASLKHHPGEALLDASAAHAVRCVDQFTPQVMASLCLQRVLACVIIWSLELLPHLFHDFRGPGMLLHDSVCFPVHPLFCL